MSDYEEVLSSIGAGDDASSGTGSSVAGYGSGLIGGILDSIIGPVMSNVQFKRAKHVSNRQMRAAQFLAENQPRWAVQGLVNAGLNPILAATKGVAPAQFAPSPKTSVAETGSFARALEGGVSSARQLSLLGTQKRILDANLEQARNEADASGYLKQKMMNEIDEIGSRIEYLEQQNKTSASQSNLNKSSELVNRWEAKLRAAAVPGAEAEAELYRTEGGEAVKQLGPIIRLIKDVMGTGRR